MAPEVRDFRYWEDRFGSGDTPWELNAPSVVVQEALSELFSGPQALQGVRVLSPGRGTGSDALELAQRGAAVIAVDWSSQACGLLQSRLAERRQRNLPGEVTVLRGDFFTMQPQEVDLVCEHTFFCAIDPANRVQYASVVARWLRPGGYLLGNFFVVSEDEARALPGLSLAKDGQGPPFATTERELREALAVHFESHMLRPASKGEPARRPGMEWIGIFRRRQ